MPPGKQNAGEVFTHGQFQIRVAFAVFAQGVKKRLVALDELFFQHQGVALAGGGDVVYLSD